MENDKTYLRDITGSGIIEQLEDPIKEYTFKELEQEITKHHSIII